MMQARCVYLSKSGSSTSSTYDTIELICAILGTLLRQRRRRTETHKRGPQPRPCESTARSHTQCFAKPVIEKADFEHRPA